jgi:hypothetical protein
MILNIDPNLLGIVAVFVFILIGLWMLIKATKKDN